MTTKTDTEQDCAELLPCPFCGAGRTEVRDNGRPWLGTRWGEPVSVSVRHWCDHVDGQPSRMIERVGRDRTSAIDAWNRRAALQSQDREDAQRYRWLRDGGNDDIGVVSGFGCADSGSSNVVGTYEYILDGEQLDAAIDHARRVEGES